MTRSRIIAIMSALGVFAAVMLAHYAGPYARYTTAPGDNPKGSACIDSMCHVGTINSGGGSASITFPNGLNYTPGVQQTLTIVVADSAAKLYGFEMTARLTSDLVNGQAGDFTADATAIADRPGFGDVEWNAGNDPLERGSVGLEKRGEGLAW